MRFKEYPLLKLLIAFIIGILIANTKLIPNIQWYWSVVWILIMAFLAWPQKFLFPYKYRYISGSFIFLLFVLLGINTFQYHPDSIKSNYFGKYNKNVEYYQLRITEPPLEKHNSIKVFVSVEAYDIKGSLKPTSGKAIVYLEKNTAALKLKYNDEIIINKSFSTIKAPNNPDQFNYKEFLSLKNIEYQVYCMSSDWHKLNYVAPKGLKYYALETRSNLIKVLQKNELKNDELGIAAGMLLGVRDMLSPELRQAYAGAGAMHILCVSGLHVGIILLIMNALLAFMKYKANLRIMKAVIILFVIWFYAFITGLSPSVVRAATMFSFVTIGQNINRHTNIYSSLSASALILLLYNPNLLFDIGFQLSYSAVVAIVILQKPLANIWVPTNLILFKIWQLITVSIAAQIGTFPLAIFYFHQFPNYFILTNLIVIPAAYIIIILGIIVIILSFIPVVSIIFAKLLSMFLFLINYFIVSIEKLPFAVTNNILITKLMLTLIIAFIISMSIWLILKKRKLIFLNLLLLILILTANIFKYNLKEELIIYHSTKNTYIAVYSNRNAFILCDSAVYKKPEIMKFQTYEHELRKGISHRTYISMDSVIDFHNKSMVFHYPFLRFKDNTIVINKSEIVDKLMINYDYLVLDKSCKNNVALPKQKQSLILTANIPKWKAKNILRKYSDTASVYNIREKGAWIL